MVFCTVWDTSCIACKRSFSVFFSSLSLSSSSSSSLITSQSSAESCAEDPSNQATIRFLKKTKRRQIIRLKAKIIIFLSYNTYFTKYNNKIAGTVDISNQTHPHTQKINAVIDLTGDSHSKQPLKLIMQTVIIVFLL